MKRLLNATKWVWVGLVVLAGTTHLATAAVLTVGQSGANYTDFSDAVNAVTEADSTIRFIDSGTYNETAQLSLTAAQYTGLTIESADGQKATLNFTNSGSYAILLGRPGITIQNMVIKNSGRDALLFPDGNGTNAVITNVNFISTVTGASTYLLGTGSGMNISYSTFLGTGADSTSGKGISANGTGITVNHCSFDQLGFAPIYNTSASTSMSVTNSAFGNWYSSNYYRAAIYWEAGTLSEDYNASWGGGQSLTYGPGATITHGGHSVQVSSYAEIFAGSTTNGNWSVHSALYYVASDWTTIGAWQVPDMVNVQDYGAVGNGTTDDTSSIQSALDTGLSVYFPKTSSYYKVSSSLTYSGHRIVSDGATIKATAITFNLLTISNVNGLYVGDLTLEYPTEQALTSACAPLTLSNCSDFLVERVIGKKGGSIYVADSDNGTVRSCQMLTAANHAYYIRSSTGITVEKCYAEKCASAFFTEDSTYISIFNNTAEDCHSGLRIEDSANVLAEGNLLRYCVNGATAYGAGSESSIFTTDITFRGNTFYHCYKSVSLSKTDPYLNHICEYALASKMYIGDLLFDNNIVIGKDESTLLTDLSSNVVFNTGIGLNTRTVATDSSGTSYYTMVPYVKYAYIVKNDGQMPTNWLFYVNFPNGVNLSAEKVLTIDAYWGSGTEMDENTMAVKLYSGQSRTGFLCQIPLYNPYEYIALPCILNIPDGVDVSSVKCIEVCKVGGTTGVTTLTFSEIRKGLKSKVGYLHSYYHSEPADGVQDAVLDSNVFVNVTLPYVNRKRVTAIAPTIITGSGITGTTAQRPATPELGWHYYDTDLSNPIYWDGSDWIDINTYWLANKVSRAVHFDGDNFVELGKDDRVDLNNYTIEGWIKPTTSAVADRNIIERCNIGTPNGYLMLLWSDNTLCGYQSVGGNFYTVMVQASFPHDNAFHHAAMTFSYNGSTSTLKLYIDGQLVDTGYANAAPNYPLQSTVIKCGNGFEGIIDDIKFYTRTLTDTEIDKSYKKFRDSQYADWSFIREGGAGTKANDYSPYGTEGTVNNNVGMLTNMNPTTCWVDGKIGKALSFDGSDDYVNFGHDTWRNVTNYTITGWIKPTDSGVPDRNIIERCNIGTPNGYLMLLYSDNTLCGYQSVGGNFYSVMCQASFPHDSQFHHVAMAFSYNGTTSTLKLYIDGELVDTGSVTGAPDAPTTSTDLKCGNNFEGVLDEIKFYTRTLNAEEIAKEFLSQ